MFSTIVILIVAFLFLVFFIFYKRDMLLKMFSRDVTSSTRQFQEQLEQTADIVIKRLEEQITHLEYLLEEANEKVISLDNKIQVVNKILNKENTISESLHTSELTLPNLTIEEHKTISSTSINNIAISTNEIVQLSTENYKDMARNDKRSSILAMADLGYDINEIAKATGISKGEIMLLLQLNKK